MIDRNKGPFKISGKVAVGVVRDSRNFSRAPTYRAHLAIVFAIAQLSCHYCLYGYDFVKHGVSSDQIVISCW